MSAEEMAVSKVLALETKRDLYRQQAKTLTKDINHRKACFRHEHWAIYEAKKAKKEPAPKDPDPTKDIFEWHNEWRLKVGHTNLTDKEFDEMIEAYHVYIRAAYA